MKKDFLNLDVINENKILKRNISDVSISNEEKYEILGVSFLMLQIKF